MSSPISPSHYSPRNFSCFFFHPRLHIQRLFALIQTARYYWQVFSTLNRLLGLGRVEECMYLYVRRTNKMCMFFHLCFNSIILSSTCFEQLSVHHQEDCTSSFTVLYPAEITIKVNKFSSYKLSSYNVTKSIKCFIL